MDSQNFKLIPGKMGSQKFCQHPLPPYLEKKQKIKKITGYTGKSDSFKGNMDRINSDFLNSPVNVSLKP